MKSTGLCSDVEDVQGCGMPGDFEVNLVKNHTILSPENHKELIFDFVSSNFELTDAREL